MNLDSSHARIQFRGGLAEGRTFGNKKICGTPNTMGKKSHPPLLSIFKQTRRGEAITWKIKGGQFRLIFQPSVRIILVGRVFFFASY